MPTLEEQIDVAVPAHTAWLQLHRVDEFPRFVGGVLHSHADDTHHARLDIKAGGNEQSLDIEMDDRDQDRRMVLQSVDGPHLKGEFTLLPLDPEHTRLQIRLEYDPELVRQHFHGSKGFALVNAIQRTVEEDLKQFKGLVEGGTKG
ncbi:SRPBCC family protein [Streptacidiphilus sp. EB103A]|uniref:SRPBCC family protein n=1 Tax=Streptacidiphilus sp. EB103A TaxID=3156275 RepID=UPI003511E647